MWKYRSLLPTIAEDSVITLGEGNTPLVRSKKIGPELGLAHLYFKLENLNPSGSYKDRFASAFISQLKASGKKQCIATSSGNTGAALSAYCAAAGIACVLVIVDGAPLPKIRQMQLYGAKTIIVEGFGKDTTLTSRVFSILDEFTQALNIPLPVSAYKYCPEGMKGVQSIMYELMDSIEVDHVFSPAGGGGLTLAMARGAKVFANDQKHSQCPKVHCVQPLGNDTIASSLRKGDTFAANLVGSFTRISGLQVPNILDGNEVIEECQSLGGTGFVVEDMNVFAYQKKLAQDEGIFSEPAGAVALAGLAEAVKNKQVQPQEKVVCLITGSGFKDMLSIDSYFDLPEIERIPADSLNQKIQNP